MKVLETRDVRTEAEIHLICFPFAGGGVEMFAPWKRVLPPEIAVCPVHLPGRGKRFTEPPHTDWRALIEEVASSLEALVDQPIALFGHSMGATVAFEVARALQDLGREPDRLFVSGGKAPHLPPDTELASDLPRDELVAKLAELEGTAPDVLEDEALMDLVISRLRADLVLEERYVFEEREPLTCPISAMGGIRDKHVQYDDLAAWGDHTTGRTIIRMFRGGHFFVKSRESEVLGQITKDLVLRPDRRGRASVG